MYRWYQIAQSIKYWKDWNKRSIGSKWKKGVLKAERWTTAALLKIDSLPIICSIPSVTLARSWLNFYKHFLLQGKYFYSKAIALQKIYGTYFKTLQSSGRKDFGLRLLRVLKLETEGLKFQSCELIPFLSLKGFTFWTHGFARRSYEFSSVRPPVRL